MNRQSIASVCFAASLAAACTAANAEGNTIKIGVITSLSGPAAAAIADKSKTQWRR